MNKNIIINGEDLSYMKGKVNDEFFHFLIEHLSNSSRDSVKELIYLTINPSHVEYLIENHDLNINNYDLENMAEAFNPEMVDTLIKYSYENLFSFCKKFILSPYLNLTHQDNHISNLKDAEYFDKLKEKIDMLFNLPDFPEKIAQNYNCCLFAPFFNEKKLDIKPYIVISNKNEQKIQNNIYSISILKELIKNVSIEKIKQWVVASEKKSYISLSHANIFNLIKGQLVEKSFLNEMFEKYNEKRPLYSLFFREDIDVLYVKENDKIIPDPHIDFSLINRNCLGDIFHYSSVGNTAYRNVIFKLLPDDKLTMLNSMGKSILHVHAAYKISALAHIISLFNEKNLDLNLLDEKGNTFIRSIKSPDILVSIIMKNHLFDINQSKFAPLKKDLIEHSEHNPFLSYLLLKKEKTDLLDSLESNNENENEKNIKFNKRL